MVRDHREDSGLMRDLREGLAALSHQDPTLLACLARERMRQIRSLSMVASSSTADPSVLICAGAAIANLTTEGYPGARFHGGCGVADDIERLAIERAKTAFGAEYANVQPHSCTTANQAVMFSLLRAGDAILGLNLSAGGHLTHGARAACSGKFFNAIGYGLNEHGLIDYASVRALARDHRPKMIICGASAYPREIHFERFREIADEIGAVLLADVSHIAGLIVAGEHPSPIDIAHITTTSTYKQLFGPRGGLILMGRDRKSVAPSGRGTLEEVIQKAVFPFFQGTPDLATVAAKARALHFLTTPQFKDCGRRIVRNAKALAQGLMEKGYEILTGGTDNHMVLISLCNRGLTGKVAESALEECGIIVNKNVIGGDRRSPLICSGIRLGTNTLAYRMMGEPEMHTCVRLVDKVLSSLEPRGDADYSLSPSVRNAVLDEVSSLCDAFPIPGYSSVL